jgi:lysophospholipid acyltransferase (LPLAT)-like uncharacterized protein
MKSFVRSPGVQRALASLCAGYLNLVYKTLRWERVEQERAESVWALKGKSGAILCFWHARIPLSPNTWRPKDGGQEMRALISKSSDGEFITLTVEKLGFPAIRGSRKREDSVGEKGGQEAFREMSRWVRSGNAIAVTPDGPAGPAQQMGDGAPSLARLTGAPVLFVGVACNPCIRFKSWDQTVLPLPFAKAAMVWDGPVKVGRDADIPALAKEWTQRLTAVTDRAEAMVK